MAKDLSELAEVPYRSRKKTRHWCKGKIGIEHDFNWVFMFDMFKYSWFKQVCSKCKRRGKLEQRPLPSSLAEEAPKRANQRGKG